MADSGVRLTDVMVALSLVTDLGFGQPFEHMLRSARIGMRIGDRLGLDDGELATLYDVCLLTYVGCPVYGNEAAAIFGDDIDFRAHALEVDLGGVTGMRFMLGRAGAGSGPLHRMRQAGSLMATGGRAVVEQMANHCAAAGELAHRLGLGPEVQSGVAQAYARWDGKGVPADLSGEHLALATRVAHVAEACELFERTAGADDAAAMVRARTGTHFDPAIAGAVLADTDALFDQIDVEVAGAVLDADPSGRSVLTDDELDDALAAVGDFCDLRVPCFAGHSAGTADLATDAARALSMPEPDVRLLRRAAFVHDVGRFGVAGSVWAHPGPLSTRDEERMRLHVYFVERVFTRPEPLRRIGLLAATHHERMDGSGYHRGVGGTMLATPARVLAVADAYQAMISPRPHRPAREPDDAARELRREADAGRLDAAAVDAVLSASGHAPSRQRAGGPAGLTTREVAVLALLAQGLPNKGIARELDISPKTVGNHIERIYSKLGVTNRAGAALRAMEYGIVTSSAPA